MKKTKQKKHAVELRPAMDQLVIGGKFAFMLGDAQGNPVWDKPLWADNTAVTSGRAWLLKHVMSAQSANVSSQIISAIAIGTGTTAPTTSDTLLVSEVARATNITETDNSGSAAPYCVWAASWATNQGNATNLAEFGIFNTSSAAAGTMLARATTAAFSKTTSNTLTVSYSISA